MSFRKYGTCFFEQYAQISLSSLLGSEFDVLVNMDRPDLQSEDGEALGIEVTRAMEESKEAQQVLLKEVAGVSAGPLAEIGAGWNGTSEEDRGRIIESGYSYGLVKGKALGSKELSYWSMALPLRRIISSKVAKVGNGFYGRFDKMGLYVFCMDQMEDADAVQTLYYTMDLQKSLDIKYNRLYLAEFDSLYVCNLDEGADSGSDGIPDGFSGMLTDSSRLFRIPITPDQRKAFYLEALRRQL